MLSIAICAYEDMHRLSLCLEGLALQGSPEVEVIVVNDGGPPLDDVLAPFARRLVLRTDRLDPPSEAYRLAAARNRALRLARAERVLFIDQDCVPVQGVLMAHAAYGASPALVAGIRRRLAESEVASLTPADVPRLADRELSPDFRMAIPRFRAITGRTQPMMPRFVSGCHVSVPAGMLRDIGGFWEAFVGWGHEEVEMAIRLGRAGCLLAVRTDLVVVHLDHPSRLAPETERRNHALMTETERNRSVVRHCARIEPLP